MFVRCIRRLCLLLGPALTWGSHADTVQVAVAANFQLPMQQIAQDFQRHSGHTAQLSFAASGKLYAQIHHGAPYAVLLAADDTTTGKLAKAGLALADTEFTYAIGKLVLWSPDAGRVDAQGQVLAQGQFRRLAIANPAAAPYGQAALAVLDHRHLRDRLTPRLVYGESIGQAYQFVHSGNAELGFVALSQVWANGRLRTGSAWLVPTDHYPPLHQNAILLINGAASPAARALLDYLRSAAAQSVIRQYGYAVPAPPEP